MLYGCGSKPIVGIGMFTGGTIWILTHGHMDFFSDLINCARCSHAACIQTPPNVGEKEGLGEEHCRLPIVGHVLWGSHVKCPSRTLLWMDEIRSHHFETMVELIVGWYLQGNHHSKVS